MAIEVEVSDRVGLITIDRPEARNALDPESLLLLKDAWKTLAEDPSVGAIVLTGAGEAFCAGMDLKKTIPMAQALARGERIPDDAFEALKAVPAATLQLDLPPQPIVAAVNGHCHGQGTDMLVATDYRIAAEEATFALEEVELGLFPRGNSASHLPKQIPYVRAIELALHIRAGGWSATEALDAMLINEVLPREKVLGRAVEVASRIASFPGQATMETLRMMRENLWASDRREAWLAGSRAADSVMRRIARNTVSDAYRG